MDADDGVEAAPPLELRREAALEVVEPGPGELEALAGAVAAEEASLRRLAEAVSPREAPERPMSPEALGVLEEVGSARHEYWARVERLVGRLEGLGGTGLDDAFASERERLGRLLALHRRLAEAEAVVRAAEAGLLLENSFFLGKLRRIEDVCAGAPDDELSEYVVGMLNAGHPAVSPPGSPRPR